MPNSYTAVPSIIPGTLTVTGNMNASGNVTSGIAVKGLQIQQTSDGAVQRMNAFTPGGSAFGVNMLTDGASRDVGTKAAWALVFDPNTATLKHRLINAAGNAMDLSSNVTLLSDLNLTQHVGDTVETTIKSKLVRAGVIPSGGLVRVRFQFSGIAQGATPSTVRVKWGANVIDSFAVATLTSYVYEAYIGWPGSTAIAQFYSIRTQITGAVTSATGGPNADIATDQTFAITFQAGANTDNGAIQMAGLDLLTTFSPV